MHAADRLHNRHQAKALPQAIRKYFTDALSASRHSAPDGHPHLLLRDPLGQAIDRLQSSQRSLRGGQYLDAGMMHLPAKPSCLGNASDDHLSSLSKTLRQVRLIEPDASQILLALPDQQSELATVPGFTQRDLLDHADQASRFTFLEVVDGRERAEILVLARKEKQ